MTQTRSDEPVERTEVLRALIFAQFPIEPLCAQLSTYPWDVDVPLVTLQRAHIQAVLSRFLATELSVADVVAWADAIEMRDDIGFAEGDEPFIARCLFLLATPDVNGTLTIPSARALLADLARDSV